MHSLSLVSILSLTSIAVALPQAPGTPAYNCHSNCGGAITAGRTAGGDESVLCAVSGDFVTQYKACLECVTQAETSYIWAIYGPSITANGAICGLSTSPNTPPPAETSPEPEPEQTPTPTPEEPTTPTPTPESPETTKEPAPTAAEEPASPTTKNEDPHHEETAHVEPTASGNTGGHHAEETVVACVSCASAATKTTVAGEHPSTQTATATGTELPVFTSGVNGSPHAVMPVLSVVAAVFVGMLIFVQ